MKHAIIDIGSNSMHLTVYDISEDKSSFKTLFKEKVMAGLAGYITDDILSSDGIKCAYEGLLEFKETVELLDIDNVSVFATASLRNIKNEEEALNAIKAATNFSIEVISGEAEALYGYTGSMKELNLTHGAFIDIGGASTEIAVFSEDKPLTTVSYPIGSLNLYRDCVKKILPGKGSIKKIKNTIKRTIDKKNDFDFDNQSPLICVGGTARAILKIAKKMYMLPDDCHNITFSQLSEICSLLNKSDKSASDLILKSEPERIHTLIPGIMILLHIAKLFNTNEIIVSKYGVREGYICQKILQANQIAIPTPKTEN